MKTTYRQFFIYGIALVLLIIVTYQVMAVGLYITELPFKGSYKVSCTYHSICSSPPTAGFGLDFVNNVSATYGDVVYASGRGTVTQSILHSDWGETIIISHPDSYRSRYAHLAYRFSSVNQKMREGSPIGYMGSTGKSTGDHLHFQTYLNTDTGQGVDPGTIDGVAVGGFCLSCVFTNSSFNTTMRLVDNTDGGFSLTGTATCYNNTANGYYADGLQQSVTYFRYCDGLTGSPTRTGTWTPTLPSSGNYHIFVFIPAHSGLVLTGFANYKVYSNNTLLETITVNQHAYANKWVRLGVFNLSTSASYLTLTNQTGDAGKPAFDAVMFVKDF
jgi:hypothetical protein